MNESIAARRKRHLSIPKGRFYAELRKARPGEIAFPNVFSRVERLPDRGGRPQFQMTCSRLPKITTDGLDIDPSWFETPKGFYTRVNCGIAANVTAQGVMVASQERTAQWKPVLYVGTRRYDPISGPEIIDDPDNENYHDNCLSWDYGVCERRIRVIEGRIREWWIFGENPHATVRIEHRLSGDLPIRFGVVQCEGLLPIPCEVDGDTEIVRKAALEGIVGPIRIGASATYYPDASPESTSVDGYVYHYAAAGDTWAAIRDGVGTTADTTENEMYIGLKAVSTQDKWESIKRGIVVFDTAALHDEAFVLAATFSLYGAGKTNTLGTSPTLNVYSAAPASEDDLVAGDYDSLGTTAYCDTPITYASWTVGGYNNYAFNATGLAAISKTGRTKVGVREVVYDVGDAEPTWVISKLHTINAKCADQGEGYEPKLIITYTVPAQRTQGVFIF